MNITFSIDEDLVKEAQKIAIERDTTLAGLVRAYLEELAAEHARLLREGRELEALKESFKQFQFSLGTPTWRREDLYERVPQMNGPTSSIPTSCGQLPPKGISNLKDGLK